MNNIKLLIVDDNQDNIDVLKYKLQMSEMNYEIIESNTGKDALKKLEELKPDIVLLDVVMPVMDGYEVANKIKEISSDKFIPIIMITAREDLGSKIKGFESGGDDYITKPFDIAELEARIRSLIRIRDLQNKVNNMHEKLLEAEKLAAVVTTVATLNHEINNPLCAILLDIQMLSMSPEISNLSNTVRQKIDKIEKSAKRIAEITQKLGAVQEVSTKDYLEGQQIIDVDKKPKN